MAENRDTHRLAVCWDDPDSGKLDLKEFYQYCWDTKGEIADAINEAADGIVSVSQYGDYKKYADAIRKMYKRIWSSADDARLQEATIELPNLEELQKFELRLLDFEYITNINANTDGSYTVRYMTKCVIRNYDLLYGKYHNYGYVDINDISAARFGDYDKYYAVSSFYVDIQNPPVYAIGDLLVGPCTLTNKSCTVTDAELEASELWQKFAAAYPNAGDIFPGDANSLTIRPVMLNYDYTTFISGNNGLMTLCNSTLEKAGDDWKKSWRVVKSSTSERSYIGRGTSYNDGDIIYMESGNETFYFRKSRHSTTATSVFVWYNVTDKVKEVN